MLIDYLNDHHFHRDERWPVRRAASISRLQVNRSACVCFVSLHCQFGGSCSCYPGIRLACDMSRKMLRNSAMHCGKQNAKGDRSSACWGFFPNSIWHLDLSFCFFFLVTADFAIFWLNFGKTSMFCRDGRQFWIQPRAGSMWKGFSEETRSAGTKLWLIQTTTSLVKLWKIITLHINRFPQPALSDQYNYYVQMKNCTFYTHYISNIMSINIGFNPGEHFLLHRRNFEAEIFAAGNSSKKKYL